MHCKSLQQEHLYEWIDLTSSVEVSDDEESFMHDTDLSVELCGVAPQNRVDYVDQL